MRMLSARPLWEERKRVKRSDLLMRLLAPRPVTVVVDVGANTGYHSRRIADLIRSSGNVYAVDVQPEMVKVLQSVLQQTQLRPYPRAVDQAGVSNAKVIGAGFHGWLILYILTVSACQGALDKALQVGGRFS